MSSTAAAAPAALRSGGGGLAIPTTRSSSPIAPVGDSEPHLAAVPPSPASTRALAESERALVVPGIHSAPTQAGMPDRVLSPRPLAAPPPPPSYEGIEDSDVFVCRPGTREVEPRKSQTSREVTLFVHGWHQVEPGLLSWTFPSLRAALDAVQRMKNAIGWCVVAGTGWSDLDTARASGAILVEQLS